MPSYLETAKPLIAEEQAANEAQLAAWKEQHQSAPQKALDIPKDPNAAYFNKLKEEGWIEEPNRRCPRPTSSRRRTQSS